MAEEAEHNPFDPGHLFAHVQDAPYFEAPRPLAGADGHIDIPQPFSGVEIAPAIGPIEPFDLKLTKFMLIEVLAAVGMVLVFSWLAAKIASGRAARGPLANFFEMILLYIRDEIARPDIGRTDGDRFLPYLWTVFFFILSCNLLGMIPWLGSPTGVIAVTGVLALMTFAHVVWAGSAKMGFVGWLKAQVPHMDVPGPMAILLAPMIFGIELMGLGIKHFVLAMRLLANIMAGHLVIVVIMAFIAAAWQAPEQMVPFLFPGVTAASVLGAAAISILELFVAFLQAYVFTKLSALFIGMAVHPH